MFMFLNHKKQNSSTPKQINQTSQRHFIEKNHNGIQRNKKH